MQEVKAETEMKMKLEMQVKSESMRGENERKIREVQEAAERRLKEELTSLQSIHAKEIQALIAKNQQEI